ncbi:MAG: hypothetical protein ACRDT8_01750 [Micromonosporaceae bacterium]
MRYGSSTAAVLIIVWVLIGVAAAGQRGYFKDSDANCASVGSTLITLASGPLNYTGLNPKLNCEVPQPSK